MTRHPTDLHIARIDVYQVDLPYASGVYHLSNGRSYHSFDATIVRITTDNGLQGWGESTPFGATYIASHAGGVRAGIAKHRARGYKGHSIKIAGEPGPDAARIAASLADQQPGEYFIVDANGGMSVEGALRMLRLLPAGLDFVLEAPCATWRECLSLRRRTDVPLVMDELATDEASIVRLVAEDAAEGVGLKISKAGGLTRARRVRDIALAAGYTMSVQETAGSDVAFAAIVHLGQTVSPQSLRCVLESRDMVALKTADGPFDVHDGCVVAPALPGLGITPRLDVLGDPVASYV